MPELRSLCVFCGASPGALPAYADEAAALGRAMAENGVRLVYGGGGIGIMGVVARAVLAHGGEVVGIIPEHLQTAEIALDGLTELHVVPDMHTRKRMMFERSDAIAVLPGGFGTLDETFEILTWKQLNLHAKPVIVVNTAGYWDGLLTFCRSMLEAGFIREKHLGMFSVVDSAPQALQAARDLLPVSAPAARPERF
ncbi:LOG family protein [Novispirillum itersonii]|uniref:Cytokinin riboside 5'-monophosphate phosphoribohydrolase n=1 Tax=Novispirillum itersonii TaxID=189 RepID=A0A7X0DP54_NOVIT|nr:TIGR00730 family Rossman fold protein [Novispirillum itersonii]MBB6212014.1 hypothetical protein [Novispirillum itersonii]